MARTASSSSSLPRLSSSSSSSGWTVKCCWISSLPSLITTTISAAPAATASSTPHWITGRSRTGSSSLGSALVAGRNRVPRPAAGMTQWRRSTAAHCRPSAACRALRRGFRLTATTLAPPCRNASETVVPEAQSVANAVTAELAAALDAEPSPPARIPGRAGRVDIVVEKPKDPSHGDVATNLPMRLAKSVGMPPRQIAEAAPRAARRRRHHRVGRGRRSRLHQPARSRPRGWPRSWPASSRPASAGVTCRWPTGAPSRWSSSAPTPRGR